MKIIISLLLAIFLLTKALVFGFRKCRFIRMTSFATAKAHDALAESDESGRFKRTAAGFRDIISQSHDVYKPQSGRYHLYVSMACPWANRCVCIIKLKGTNNFNKL
jgi:glutathionyl-hydroquinone reductase